VARQNQLSQENAVRQHANLIAEYDKLIPKIKFVKGDKEIDEFSTAECIICMEAFN